MARRGGAAMPRPKASGRVFPVTFTDVAAAAGLTAPQTAGGVTKKYILEAMGSGVAFLDYDNDGWPDVFLVNGGRWQPAADGPSNRLYRNNRDGTFSDVTAKAGLLHSGWGQGVTAADFDNNGYDDLFVTEWGHNTLYRNNGDGTFTDLSRKAGVAGDAIRWGSGAAFFDYDRDGFTDLFVANYLDFDLKKTPLPGSSPNCKWLGLPVFCGPRDLPFSSNLLYRNNGDGTFTDVSAASGIGAAKRTYALGVIAADLDGDRWPDIYVASDSTRSLFYHNNGDGTFSERGIYIGLAYDENGAEQAGMGATAGDYDNDGLLDIVKTNFADDYPNLYRSLGKAGFDDAALKAGLGVNPQYVLWGVHLSDFDNDGWPDLFLAAGHVFPEVDRLRGAQTYRNPRLLYWNLGNGAFEDVSDRAGPGIAARHSSRGSAVGDFNRDGTLDVLVMNADQPPSLLRNTDRSGNHWVEIKLEGTRSNRSAIGGQIKIGAGGIRQTGVVLSQSGYFSVSDSRVHFGLGKADAIESVEVTWPTGLTEQFTGVKPDAVAVLKEGTGAR
jgi:hypothetical protein